jgi:hypothetical protein
MPNEDLPVGDLIDSISNAGDSGFDWGNFSDIFNNSFNNSPVFSPEAMFPDMESVKFPDFGYQGFPSNAGEALYPGWGATQDQIDKLTAGKGGGGGGSTWDNILNTAGKGGLLFKNIAEPALGITKAVQMADYDKNYAKWVKAQNDYIKKKQEYDAKFMGEFDQAQEQFHAANEEFQGQIEAASGQANEVLQQYLNAAKPLLAQSQEMLVPGVAALARGEVPEQWQPILEQAKQRAMASAVQSMVSAGMSPDEARASIAPKLDQDAHVMLLQLASSLVTQGLATGAQGGQFLQGAGQMSQILGQLAAAGMSPYSQEFQTLANIIGHIMGPTSLVPPGKPVA